MSEKENTNTSSIAGTIRSSLVIKLNIRMLGRLFTALLVLNVLFCVLFFIVSIWKAEEGTRYIVENIEDSIVDNKTPSYFLGGYKVFRTEETMRGIVLPKSLQNSFLAQIPNAKRSLTIAHLYGKKSFLEKVKIIKYNIEFLIDEDLYRIEYDLGNDFKMFLPLFFIILIFELLILIKNIGKGSRSIKKTLRPLSEMAERARSLNDELASIRSNADGRYIKNLAGAISSIDANKLDKRISVDTSQNELKDLAASINDMLNRIGTAYHSQVRFVSDASHELRTPISVIQGYVNLLDRWGKEDEKTMQEAIDAIKSETQNMKELVEHLLFLARGDNETIRLHEENIDVCSIIDEIIKEAQMIDPNHKFEINLNRPSYINADRQLFKQAIRILIDNSIKYTPEGEIIILKVVNEEDNVRIIIQDNGIGISPEDIQHIFDRFYRSDESRARKTGGSGLGLSIAKWIIERHGGHFEVLSRLDIGTRITIIMPISDVSG